MSRRAKRHCNEEPGAREIVLARIWCEDCGKRGREVHHSPPKGMGGTTKVYKADPNAEYRLLLLCYRCHKIKRHRERLAEKE